MCNVWLSAPPPLQKSGVAVFLTAGFSLTAYLLQAAWSQAQALLESYYHYVIAYFVIAGCASFAFCYYKVISSIWTLRFVSVQGGPLPALQFVITE